MLLTQREHDEREPIDEGDPLPPPDRVELSARHDLGALYRAHRSRFLRLFTRSASRDAAPDLCQQLFLNVAALPNDHAIANPVGYLHRAAGNLAIDHARAAALRPAASDAPLDTIECAAPDQIQALEARDMLRRLEAALARLNPRTREIFLAHRLDGYSYREISARTGLGVKAVEKHMSRAIAHLDRLSGLR